jgi:hypothetical protein
MKTTPDGSAPEIYIIRDQESLINKMYYILECYQGFNNPTTDLSDPTIKEEKNA